MGTVLQCRKFGFFDVNENIDDGSLAEDLKDVEITCTSSGFGLILIGDSKGFAHIVNRQLQVTSFEAHSFAVSLAVVHSNSNLAVTCSNPERGGPTELKVWLPQRQDVSGVPICARVLTLDSQTSFVSERGQLLSPTVTAIALHPNNTLMALGFSDGSVLLHRGDIRRPKGVKPKLIVTLSSGAVTNMHVRLGQESCHLFVTTVGKIYCINVTNKQKETTIELDCVGCAVGCSALADTNYDHTLLIAKKDAIYSYTTDSKAACYVFEGDKKHLAMYKGYLIVASEQNSLAVNKSSCSLNITVYDPVNKLICLSTVLEDVCGIVCEWASIYVITNKPSLIHLSEKDLQSKFEILFKKNQFDIAISLAKMQRCDAEDVCEIVKQYGDWLYAKGSYSSAMQQYIKTIPHLETSYVIKKYLDIQHVQSLTTYLQALHTSGHSTSDHTMLLLNCFTRIQDGQQLDQFIKDKQGDLDCDVDMGITVCRNAGYFDHALSLAKQYHKHEPYLSILISEKKDYEGAIQYMAALSFEDVRHNILQHGSTLLNHCPDQMIDLLFLVCTDYQPTTKQGGDMPRQADPEDFEYLLVGHSQCAISLLEKLGQHGRLSPHLNTTLLAELLHQYSVAPLGQRQTGLEAKIVNMLRNDESTFDRSHALLLCDKHDFASGKLILWEQAAMFEELLGWYCEVGDYCNVVNTCKVHGQTNPRLWCIALRLLTSNESPHAANPALIDTILTNIEEGNLLPAMEVVDILSCSPHICLGQVRSYLLRVVAKQTASASAEGSSIEQHRHKTTQMKEGISNITFSPRDFTNTKCSACKMNLDLPSIHFLCKHSFHVHCFESYTEGDSGCPLCLSDHKKLKESASTKEKQVSQHHALQDQLEKATNSFDVMSHFVSQGALTDFQTLESLHPSLNTTKVPDISTRIALLKPKQHSVLSEARLRLEQTSHPLPTPTEARLRQAPTDSAHRDDGSSHREASIQHHVSSSYTPTPSKPSPPTISESVSNAAISYAPLGNPFDQDDSSVNPFDQDYDETKNPFALEDTAKPMIQSENPFDEYDQTLNPFDD